MITESAHAGTHNSIHRGRRYGFALFAGGRTGRQWGAARVKGRRVAAQDSSVVWFVGNPGLSLWRSPGAAALVRCA